MSRFMEMATQMAKKTITWEGFTIELSPKKADEIGFGKFRKPLEFYDGDTEPNSVRLAEAKLISETSGMELEKMAGILGIDLDTESHKYTFAMMFHVHADFAERIEIVCETLTTKQKFEAITKNRELFDLLVKADADNLPESPNA